jgi:hypothetical protein
MDVSQAQEAKQLGDENTLAEAGGRSESGQGCAAVGDWKKRVELAVLKPIVEQVREKYVFSERRAG